MPELKWYEEKDEYAEQYDRLPYHEQVQVLGTKEIEARHYKKLIRLGIKVCLCGHVHPATIWIDKKVISDPKAHHHLISGVEQIDKVLDRCWDTKECLCSVYEPSNVFARDCTKEELDSGVVFKTLLPENPNVFDGLADDLKRAYYKGWDYEAARRQFYEALGDDPR